MILQKHGGKASLTVQVPPHPRKSDFELCLSSFPNAVTRGC
jgi:hypothetical protein